MGFNGVASSWSNLGMRAIEKLAGGPAVAVEAPGQEAVQTLQRKDGRILYRAACCNLALKPISPGQCWNRCEDRSGYSMRSWGCCHRGGFYSCLECARGNNCSAGPFACSAYQPVQGGCA